MVKVNIVESSLEPITSKDKNVPRFRITMLNQDHSTAVSLKRLIVINTAILGELRDNARKLSLGEGTMSSQTMALIVLANEGIH